MSLDLSCYCAEPAAMIAEIIVSLRVARGDLFVNSHILNDPESLSEPTAWNEAEKKIASGFGIAAKSSIYILVDDDHAEQVQEIADAIYDSLGPGKVVVTLQTDHLIPYRGSKT